MNLDAPTIYSMFIVTALALTVALAFVAKDGGIPGLWYLAGYTFSSALIYVLYQEEGLPEAVNIALPNSMVAVAGSLLLLAIATVRGSRVHPLLVYAPPLVVFVVSLLLMNYPTARLTTVNMLLLLQRVPTLWILVRRGGIGIGHGRHIVLVSVLAMTLLFALRAVVIGFGVVPTPVLAESTLLNTTTYIVSYLTTVLVTLGFVLAAVEMAADQNHRLAMRDELTGLPNRRAALEALDREWAATGRHEQPLSLLMLDLDHFKQINDRYGHPAGDAVIQQVADLLRTRLRGQDVAGRFGGEEFVIILPDTAPEGARALAEVLRAEIAEMVIDVGGQVVRITTSIGLYGVWPNEAESIPELIRRADAALYRAKAGGRNQVAAG
jgi:diguanylate cyclase (GGDEF)-like protein